jgi:hypothetical protein
MTLKLKLTQQKVDPAEFEKELIKIK